MKQRRNETMKQGKFIYTQTDIANKVGVSKATVSRYLSKKDVARIVSGNSILYDETTLEQASKDLKKTKNTEKRPSIIELLEMQIDQLKQENQLLKEQLKIKDKQIETLATLTTQAQQLNALDKDRKEIPEPEEKEKPHKKHWWQK